MPARDADAQRSIVPSPTHLVLIPSYNAGDGLCRTVVAARRHWAPVWVVIDGSDDGSAAAATALAAADDGVPRDRAFPGTAAREPPC